MIGAALWCAAALLPHPDGARGNECEALAPVSIERGACLARARQWQEAEGVFRAYRALHRDSVPAALGHAEVLLQMQHILEASETVRKLAEAHPNDASVLKVQAWISVNVDKNPAAAGEILERVTRLAPRDADAWRLLGLFYLDAHREDEAVRSFEQATALDPASALYRAGLARALATAGRSEQAAAAFDAALSGPRAAADATALLWYGDFLSRAGRHEESIQAYSRALRIDGSSGEAWLRKAAAEASSGRFREAEHDALEAGKRAANEREVQLVLVRAYRGLGEEAKAQAAAGAVEAVSRAEEDRRARWRHVRKSLDEAGRLMEAQRFPDALPLYLSVTREVPDYSDAWLAAGICLVETGAAARGEAAFRTYLKLQPLSAEGHTALGALLVSEKRFAEARAELSEALRLDPGSAVAKEVLEALPQ